MRAISHSSFTELYTDIAGSLGGSEGPRLAVVLPEHPIEWDAGGYVVQLDSYVADPVYGLGSGEAGDFPTAFWNQDVVAGTRLGVPAQRSARVVIYNKAWARELGFEDEPVTEALENLEQLRWLEAGRRMRVVAAREVPLGIDTAEDYRAFVERTRRAGAGRSG